MEFSQMEIRRSRGPFSLVWMGRSLRAWLYGAKPWESLLLGPPMDEIKRRLDPNGPYGGRYFESVIQKYFLDNPHRALVTVEPKADFLTKQEAKLAERLSTAMAKLGEDEKRGIAEKCAALELAQSEADSPEALSCIPHLSRADLSCEPDLVPRSYEDLGGIPALCHALHTNGISYVDLAFPLDTLSRDDYEWLPFFSQAVTSVGLPGMDYAEVSSLLAGTVGGFNAMLHTGSAAPLAGSALAGGFIQTPVGDFDLAGRDWIVYRLKCLDAKAVPSLDIALRLINEADFSDLRRMKDLVLEARNNISSTLAPSGSRYASSRTDRLTSYANETGEIWNGLSQLLFAQKLATMDVAEVAAKLESLRDAIRAGGTIANIAGSASAIRNTGSAVAAGFGSFGPPKPRAAGNGAWKPAGGKVCEVFASPSLQVGFAAMALKAAPFDTVSQTAEGVLSHWLSTGALWEDIRMKGGAYGAFAGSDSLERCFSLSTYRDPDPLRSLESFSSILKTRAADSSAILGGDDLVKTIIGCYSRETRPQAPSSRSVADFFRFMTRIDDAYRARKLKRLVGVSAGEVADALGGLASQEPLGRAVITGMKDAEQVAKALGTDVRELPV